MSFFVGNRPPAEGDMKKSDYDKNANNIVDIAEGLLVWQENTTYSQNNIVVYNKDIWKCTVEHISSTEFDESKFMNLTELDIELISDATPSELTTYSSEKIEQLLQAKQNSSELSQVAISGDYNDLINKPTITGDGSAWEEF